MIWVKICGNTSQEDALAAAEAGADALGFVFVPISRRSVTREQVSKILPALPSSVMTVGVVANESPEFLQGLLRVCALQALQFHGEEPPEEVLGFKGAAKLIKTIRVKNAESLSRIPLYRGVDAVLLDTYRENQRGGTGTVFDWGLAVRAKEFGIPVIVAGGLNPSNVGQLVRQVEPYGVDVASGVEESPGCKDHALVREFIVKAKRVYNE